MWVRRARNKTRSVSQLTFHPYVVTFLSILANRAIALPLSPQFPTSELRYIVNDAKAAVVLASEKMQEKAADVLEEDIDTRPVYSNVEKILAGSESVESVEFSEVTEDKGGMMLYTSGTTSRPVSNTPNYTP